MFLCFLFVFFTVASALADTVTLVSTVGGNRGGFATAPYIITVGSQSYLAFCDDFADHVTIGESWTGTLLNFSSYTDAMWGLQPSAEQNYEAAAWLISQEPAGGNPAIQYALWALFDPTVKTTSGWSADAQTWLNEAQSGTYSLSQFSNYSIVFPTPDLSNPELCQKDAVVSCPQEFIVDTVAQTPEPASLSLMGIGFFMVLLLAAVGKYHRMRI